MNISFYHLLNLIIQIETAFICFTLLKAAIIITHRVGMCGPNQCVYFQCVFSVSGLFLIISCCVGVEGSSTLGSWQVLSSVLLPWGSSWLCRTEDSVLLLRCGHFGSSGSAQFLQQPSRSCHPFTPPPVEDNVNQVLSHNHTPINVEFIILGFLYS